MIEKLKTILIKVIRTIVLYGLVAVTFHYFVFMQNRNISCLFGCLSFILICYICIGIYFKSVTADPLFPERPEISFNEFYQKYYKDGVIPRSIIIGVLKQLKETSSLIPVHQLQPDDLIKKIIKHEKRWAFPFFYFGLEDFLGEIKDEYENNDKFLNLSKKNKKVIDKQYNEIETFNDLFVFMNTLFKELDIDAYQLFPGRPEISIDEFYEQYYPDEAIPKYIVAGVLEYLKIECELITVNQIRPDDLLDVVINFERKYNPFSKIVCLIDDIKYEYEDNENFWTLPKEIINSIDKQHKEIKTFSDLFIFMLTLIEKYDIKINMPEAELCEDYWAI